MSVPLRTSANGQNDKIMNQKLAQAMKKNWAGLAMNEWHLCSATTSSEVRCLLCRCSFLWAAEWRPSVAWLPCQELVITSSLSITSAPSGSKKKIILPGHFDYCHIPAANPWKPSAWNYKCAWYNWMSQLFFLICSVRKTNTFRSCRQSSDCLYCLGFTKSGSSALQCFQNTPIAEWIADRVPYMLRLEFSERPPSLNV